MAGRAVQVAYRPFLDNSGELLNGGKLKFYQAGTSTAQAIYTSADKTGPTIDEVALNTYGEPTTQVYWDGPLKIESYDADDVLLNTYQDLTYYTNDFPDNTFYP